MENKLDILTRKLYDEGVEKANQEAASIIEKAKEEAARLIADAQAEALKIKDKGLEETEQLKKKAESEMALSARQALTALKQSISGLLSGRVAEDMAEAGFKDKAFVQQLLLNVVQKWDVTAGSLNLEVILSPEEKEEFEAFVTKKYKDLLSKGLEIKAGDSKGGFLIQPLGGGFQIAFSEEVFEAFFNQYIRTFTKGLLYSGE